MDQTLKKPIFQKYPAFKDSGEVWLGAVPENWELTRLGTYFLERRIKVSDKDFSPLSVTKNGIRPQLASAAKSNDGDNRKLVKKGDFVINSRSDRKGSSGIAKEDGSVSLINIVMTPNGIEPMYCNYLLKSTAFVEENYRIGHGIVADLWTTRYDEMKNIKVAIPSDREQNAIANFLDEKTTKIDRAIAQKQKMIELLKERKQIIIQNAVTKGLDPNVKMKDSGVDWIGEIPEHWEVKELKRLKKAGSAITYGIVQAGPNIEKGVPYIRTGDMSGDKLPQNGYLKTSRKIADSFFSSRVDAGDLVIAIRATLGKALLVPDYLTGANLTQGTAKISPGPQLLSKFIFFVVNSKYIQTEIDFYAKGTTFREITLDKLRRLKIMVPPIAEQKEITDYLKEVESKILKSISLQQTQIKKLKEYKATLIDSAVTGKIKVNLKYP